MTSLRSLAFDGAKWASIARFGQQALQMVIIAILARLLSPVEFGFIGMALIITGLAELFKDLGTSSALVQRKDLSDKLTSSVFWVNLGFGVLVTVLIYLTAPLAATFFRTAQVTNVLQGLAPGFFISSLGLTHKALLERSLGFRQLAGVELMSTLSGGVVGIGTAYMGCGVWSLVLQSLAASTITVVMLWATSGWRPKMAFDWQEVRTVGRYSINLLGFNVFNYLTRNADYALIGRYLGPLELGYYSLAYRLMLYPMQMISGTVGRVMFPILSQIQDDPALFRRVYVRAVAVLATVTFPMSLGLMAVSKVLVLTIFGLDWLPVVILLLILSPIGMFQSIGTTVGVVYQSKGRTDWLLRWGIFSGVLTVFAFAIGLQWGAIGVAVAYALVSLLLAYPSFVIPFRLIDLKMSEFLRPLRIPLTNSLLMLTILVGLRHILPDNVPNGVIFGGLVFVGVALYGYFSFIWNRHQLNQLVAGLRGTL